MQFIIPSGAFSPPPPPKKTSLTRGAGGLACLVSHLHHCCPGRVEHIALVHDAPQPVALAVPGNHAQLNIRPAAGTAYTVHTPPG